MVPTDEAARRSSDEPEPLLELDWGEITEAGCYLLVATGLLARVHADEAETRRKAPRSLTGARVARLSSNPSDPLQLLRTIAESHHYPVSF
jgi:hypothetical protein